MSVYRGPSLNIFNEPATAGRWSPPMTSDVLEPNSVCISKTVLNVLGSLRRKPGMKLQADPPLLWTFAEFIYGLNKGPRKSS
ncbi:hypothetical protein PHLCEN_2v3088 [Hermanssonia centrifuga]|uniref:Uncharacterized protein n=1 Tax=Hermanssonia centrifuga TaxID=98765 RepID=A0A2R6R758_9APHY|nr:hypothetical protein PHLCEN_2v3088 [Hermanssonia centrifuga]